MLCRRCSSRTSAPGAPTRWLALDNRQLLGVHGLGELRGRDGDGQIVIGAEQWPDCPNLITQCANSSWFQWIAGFPQLLGPYVPTNDQTFVPTELLAGEAVVTSAQADQFLLMHQHL